MKIVERKCPPGKWRFGFREVIGHHVTGVSLRGIRRPWPLHGVDKEEFFTRAPLAQHKDFNQGAATLWSTPTIYTQDGWTLYIWPPPKHEWIIQLHLKEKAA